MVYSWLYWFSPEMEDNPHQPLPTSSSSFSRGGPAGPHKTKPNLHADARSTTKAADGQIPHAAFSANPYFEHYQPQKTEGHFPKRVSHHKLADEDIGLQVIVEGPHKLRHIKPPFLSTPSSNKDAVYKTQPSPAQVYPQTCVEHREEKQDPSLSPICLQTWQDINPTLTLDAYSEDNKPQVPQAENKPRRLTNPYIEFEPYPTPILLQPQVDSLDLGSPDDNRSNLTWSTLSSDRTYNQVAFFSVPINIGRHINLIYKPNVLDFLKHNSKM